jgi:CxxC motif-containing protein (DUF1111 family)
MIGKPRSWPTARIAIAFVLLTCVLCGAAARSASVRADERERVDNPADKRADERVGIERTGGDTTVFDDGHNAYGRTLANLDPLRMDAVRSGKQRFVQQWPQHGPWADAASCADCHYRDGRGPRPDMASSGLALLLRLGTASGGADPRYGAQLRRIGYGVPAPGQFTVRWQEVHGRYPSGERYTLRRPTVRISELAQGPLDTSTRISLRAPPAVFGLGLIEAIPDRAIVSYADPLDADGDGISGRAQRVRDPATGRMVLGRFGWKAAKPSLAAQSATALRQDLGVDESTSVSANASANASEVSALVGYLKALAVPARRRWTESAAQEGEALFTNIGCAKCHRPSMTTGQEPDWPELSGQTIRPYTDLLLHDMGPSLADGVTEGDAAGTEWRTPPLWGLGLLPVVNGETRLLHDGRARSPEEAILWHAGEATSARHRFQNLPRAQRDALTTFLATL